MRALLAKLNGPWLFVRYIEEFAKNHVRENEGQLYNFFVRIIGTFILKTFPLKKKKKTERTI